MRARYWQDPRIGIAAFTKRARLPTSSPELDVLEQRWWDDNAALLDRVWTLPPDVRHAIRAPLARRVREFFGSGTILEIGCGSGWLGRMIAGDGVRVIGVDFSAAQIAIAREEARRAGLTELCEYRVADFNAALSEPTDGVLVHAALHHLAEDELQGVLAALAGVKARRLFLYEPVFPASPRVMPARLRRVLRRATTAALRPRGLVRTPAGVDSRVLGASNELIAASSAAGWFFSPKEVPFEERRFLGQLQPYFEVLGVYPVHHWSLQVAQQIGLIDDAEQRAHAAQREIPRALRRDRFLFRSRLFRLFSDSYIFFAFELRVR